MGAVVAFGGARIRLEFLHALYLPPKLERAANDQNTVYGVRAFTTEMCEALAKFFDEHKCRPAIAKVFEWEDAKSAFEMLAKKEGFGKIVVRVGSKDEE